MKLHRVILIINVLFLSALFFNGTVFDPEANDSTLKEKNIYEKVKQLECAEFLENNGQLNNDEILYYSYLPEGMAGFTNSKIIFWISDYPEFIEYSFKNANSVVPEAMGEVDLKSNYFRGDQAITDVSRFTTIIYENLWDGIDLIYKTTGEGIKYVFYVEPYANPSEIEICVTGQTKLTIFSDAVELELGQEQTLRDDQLVVKQDQMIDAKFVRKSDNSYGFALNQYDPSKKLIIDPLLYSTYVGGDSEDWGEDIYLDANGYAYLTGYTMSTDFPTVSGYDTTHDGTYDVFVFKLSPTGDSLLYSTYIGGDTSDYGQSIYVDGGGYAYVTGYTQSANFPTVNAYNPVLNGSYDAFVLKLAPSGNSLLYSTYIGGTSSDYSQSIYVDDEDSAYITGYTQSINFPTTNFSDSNLNGTTDAFVLKLSPTGDSLNYSTYVGGESKDYAEDICVDINGSAYVTGRTYSTDFPTTNAYDATLNGTYDAFVFKLTPTGDSFNYSTFVGGESTDRGEAICVDESKNVYITGYTSSIDFPMVNEFDSILNGTYDAFVFKLNSTGDSLEYSTFIGGSSWDYGEELCVDSLGYVYVTGTTGSSDFPMSEAYDNSSNGALDVFVCKLSPNEEFLLYSTYIGGEDDDYSYGLGVDSSGNAYIVGGTKSLDFPMVNAYNSTHNDDLSFDVFVFKLGDRSDVDYDNLSHYEEVVTFGTDPHDSDSDDDNMPDNWEIQMNLDPLNDTDNSTDLDGDGMINYHEYTNGTDVNDADTDDDGLNDYFEHTYGTLPLNNDTDDDGMPDGWEVNYGLDPTLNDSNSDDDIDGMPNIWEYQMNLDPSNITDGSIDIDGDGLTNYYEYTNDTDVYDPDTDDDGLNDYFEFLNGTLPRNNDTDGDGMPDGWEVDNGLDPIVWDSFNDTDVDDLTAIQEYKAGTDPNDADSDDDGLLDGLEVVQYHTNPLSNDTDGDSLLDNDELTNQTNPNNADSDQDGLSDYEEVVNLPSDPNDADSDDDGLIDSEEIAAKTDPTLNDTDNDGLTDYEELKFYFTNATEIDTDLDGLNDTAEIQLGTNPNLNDTDADGLDDYDEVQYGTNPNLNDTDADGLSDLFEVVTNISDPTNADTDQDGLSDYAEINTYGTEPNNTDSDSDNMPDAWEAINGTDPLTDDADDDDDLDGMSNYFEYLNKTNPISADPDNDLLTDTEELILGTDPFVNDTDADGLLDGEEIKTYGTNVTHPDTDHDFLSDGDEILYGTDPNNPDTDDDDILDFVEMEIYGTDPLLNDTDGDNLLDRDEIDLFSTNPLVIDTDSDGLTAYEEVAIYNTDTKIADTDFDKLLDGQEISHGSNPFESDTDADGLSDYEEVIIYLTNVTGLDTDADGLQDGEEVLIYNTEPLNNDTDDDGMPDGWEVFYSLAVTYSDGESDKDNDGLTNYQEWQEGTNPTLADTDGDGHNDLKEINNGTDPNDPEDRPTADNTIMIAGAGLAGAGTAGVGGHAIFSWRRKKR